MTPEQVKAARDIIADYRYSDAAGFRERLAEALDEIDKLSTAGLYACKDLVSAWQDNAEIRNQLEQQRALLREREGPAGAAMINEILILRTVAEAAEAIYECDNVKNDAKLAAALKEWRDAGLKGE